MLPTLTLLLALQTGPSATNVGQSVPRALYALHQSGPWTVWVTREDQDGGVDLDGDGQAKSAVLFVRDDRTGEVSNFGVAA